MANTDTTTGPVQLVFPGMNGSTTTVPVPTNIYQRPGEYYPIGGSANSIQTEAIITEVTHRVRREFEDIASRLLDAVRAETYQATSRISSELECVAIQTHQLQTQFALITQTLSDLLKELSNDIERRRPACSRGEECSILDGGSNQGSSPVGLGDAVGDGVFS